MIINRVPRIGARDLRAKDGSWRDQADHSYGGGYTAAGRFEVCSGLGPAKSVISALEARETVN